MKLNYGNRIKMVVIGFCIVLIVISSSAVSSMPKVDTQDKNIQKIGTNLENIRYDLINTEGKILDNSQSKSLDHRERDIPPPGTVIYPNDLQVPQNADYLIITSNTFYLPAKQDFQQGTQNNCLNEFAFWRANYSGFDVAVVSVDDPFIGGNTDIAIKQFVQYVYDNWQAPHMSDGHLGYILLVGDTLFVTTHPIRLGNPAYGVSDRWYGCMDSDWYPEIKVGRFSVDDYYELSVIVEKTIHFEQNPEPGNWRNTMLMTRGTMGPFYEYDFIKKILLEDGGWNVSEVFMENGGTAGDICNAINNGTVMVNYWGHGSFSSWEMGFDSEDITHLSNGNKLSFVLSSACHTGEFQNIDDCFGEVLTNTPGKGAVAFYGASTLGGIDSYTFYALKAMFEKFKYRVGDIINEIIAQFPDFGDEYNLLGDPALDLSCSLGRLNKDKPDLTLSNRDITISPNHSTPEENNINIIATIHNIGGGTARNVAVQFISIDRATGNEQIIGNQTIFEILPHGQITLLQQYNFPLYFVDLVVQVDPNNTIDEAYELNNQAGTQVAFVDDGYTNMTPGWRVTHFAKIQDGINAVTHGTVIVYSGTYHEHLTITTPLVLIGDNKDTTIIEGDGNASIVKISAHEVMFSGFTIQNYVTNGYGVSLEQQSSDNILSDNRIIHNLGYGIYENGGLNNTIINNDIIDNNNGVYLAYSDDSIISKNNIINNNIGILLEFYSSNNIISKNNITDNSDTGISLNICADSNTIFENMIAHNGYGSTGSLSGIYLAVNQNSVYHNNFIENNQNAFAFDWNINIWNKSYPSGGNYWSDYHDPDEYQGPDQNIPGSDGIGDIPCTISENNQDHYPFMEENGWLSPLPPLQPIDITAWHIYPSDLYKGIGGYPGKYNGQPYSYQSTSTEAGSDLYFTFYWGDTTSTVVGPVSSGIASAIHIYALYGTYSITVTVKHGLSGTPSLPSTAHTVNMYKSGDMNCDGGVTFADIDLFVEALAGHATYAAAHPNFYWYTADCNFDHGVTFADIDPFVSQIGN